MIDIAALRRAPRALPVHVPQVAGLVGVAALYGWMVATSPLLAAGAAAAILVAVLAFAAPVVHVGLLVFLTTIVPYSVSNQYGLAAGPGLLLSDLFLITGLARAVVVLIGRRLGRPQLLMVLLVAAFCLWAVVGAYLGVRRGGDLSAVGAELRALGGYGAAIIIIAVLLDRGAQERTGPALLALGLILGLWGVAQWMLDLPFGAGQDYGVREGVAYAPGGRGQVQGGLFVFPVAVILSAAVLIDGNVRRRVDRIAVTVALALNGLSLLLTFERTFWVVAALGVAVALLRSGHAHRGRAALWIAVGTTVALAGLAALSPSTLQTAQARLLSIGQFESDGSLRYRRVESEHVLREIADRPVAGSGLAAAIWWGRPWEQVPARIETYSHNGLLRVAWRLGILGCALLLVPLALAITWRGRPDAAPVLSSLRTGAQASILALVTASATFPVFTEFAVTTALGLLLGICALPRAMDEPRARG